MVKKIIILITFISIQLIAFDLSLLHTQKQAIQKEKLNEIKASHQNQKYNWVSPLNFSLSKNRSKSASDAAYSTLDKASIRFNQDIFRSGGIYYTLSFADTQKSYQLLSLERENVQLYEQIFTTVLTLKHLILQLRQIQYRLKNSEIDVFLKQEQYKTGSVDMTEFNRAIMDKNEQLKQIIKSKESIAKTQKALAKVLCLVYNRDCALNKVLC